MKKLCERAGVKGYFTNHSFRRSCAMRLYHGGADEQEIMAITGHRSKDGVRTYKEISCNQEEKLSNMIQPGSEKLSDLVIEPSTQTCDTVEKKITSNFNFSNYSVTFNNHN